MNAKQHFLDNKQINPASVRVLIEAEMEPSFRLVSAPLLPGIIADRIVSVKSAALVAAQRWTAAKPGQHLLLELGDGETLDVPFRISDKGQVSVLSTRLHEGGSPVEAYYASDLSEEAYADLQEKYPAAPAKKALDSHLLILCEVKAVSTSKESGDLWFSRFGYGRYQLTQIIGQLYQATQPVPVRRVAADLPDAFEEPVTS